MEGPTKRQTTFAVPASQPQSYDTGKLATVGMRIRKSVADGHTLAGAHSYNSQYFNSYSTLDEPKNAMHDSDYHRFFLLQNGQRPLRVPLPSNMSQPPALTSDGSTFQSGLNVSEWGAPSMTTQNLPDGAKLKRKFSECGPSNSIEIQMNEVPSFLPSYDQFVAQNGLLSFNEEF